MRVNELIALLQNARNEAGYNAEIRFYTDMIRHAPDDEIETTPDVEVNHGNEPCSVSLSLYSDVPDHADSSEIERAAAKAERERVLAAIESEAYPLLGRTCQHRLAPVIARLRAENGGSDG